MTKRRSSGRLSALSRILPYAAMASLLALGACGDQSGSGQSSQEMDAASQDTQTAGTEPPTAAAEAPAADMTAQDTSPEMVEDIAAAGGTPDYPTQLLWGDTHLHTNNSVDANGMGNKRLTPDDAYRFAKGETVTAHNGMDATLDRPLDFLVIADHAVNLGVLPAVQARDPLVMATEVGRKWADLHDQYGLKTEEIYASGDPDAIRKARSSTGIPTEDNPNPGGFFWLSWTTDYVEDPTFRQSVWDGVCAEADRHNTPGEFTALIGFEWTPPTTHPRSSNLHRVVIFKDGGDKACQVLPFSIQDSANVEDLWAYMEDYETRIEGSILSIGHNGNISQGRMFALDDFNGDPLDRDYAETRSRWEPLYEVTQYKGDGEAHPILSPNDEFADYETWNVHGFFRERPENWAEQKETEYARSALKLGLDQEAKIGVNPFKFGMIGSTDAHTSLATSDEDNFWGKTTMLEKSAARAIPVGWHFASSGYAAVWAHENTRDSIFTAMRRKETYATTGPRMIVRFFGGWDYDAADADQVDLAAIGYTKGVPMGGDLTNAPEGTAPRFLIRAVKDPDGANLDRVQVIKGWRTTEGTLEEKVYDVAVSDGREIPAEGDVAPVGSTVDLAGPSYTNTIGAPEFALVWTDPDFDPEERAFYYVRVIEIPTPRWTAYDRVEFGLQDEDWGDIPLITQERAYTSPIWYTPS